MISQKKKWLDILVGTFLTMNIVHRPVLPTEISYRCFLKKLMTQTQKMTKKPSVFQFWANNFKIQHVTLYEFWVSLFVAGH